MMLATGDKAPLFTASGTEGDVELAALLAEGPVVLYFFPRAFTPG
jgi:peroxiredoxin